MTEPGLCGRCRHARVITSRRGSTFYLCGLSAVDPRFPRYPRLPVLRCPGFEPEGEPDPPAEQQGDGEPGTAKWRRQ